jgi:hypothetical protein
MKLDQLVTDQLIAVRLIRDWVADVACVNVATESRMGGERQLCPLVSIGQRNTDLKSLHWGLVLQGFSGPLVKLACNSAEFGLTKARCISSFREVLAQKSVGIFVAGTLSCIARQASVKQSAERDD